MQAIILILLTQAEFSKVVYHWGCAPAFLGGGTVPIRRRWSDQFWETWIVRGDPVNDIELLAELIDELARDLRPEIQALTVQELAWQPGPESNSIGVTLWHIARGLDLLATRVLQGKPAEEELWHTRGWREKTGYDPRGVGYGGWGVLTGYTWEDVQAIPQLAAEELLTYLDEVCTVVTAQIRTLTSETARQPAATLMDGRLSYYRWIKEFYKGFQAHVGEIMALKALMKKAAASAE
jgi:hypothetical protein